MEYGPPSGKEEKKILILSPYYPLPENVGGRMRTMNFARFFKKYGEVDLLYLRSDSKESNNSNIFRKEYCINPWRESKKGRNGKRKGVHILFKERIKMILDGTPPILTQWHSDSLEEFVNLVEKGKYDLILCRYIQDTYPLFKLRKEYRKKIIIDFDDIYSDIYFDEQIINAQNLYSKFKKLIINKFIMYYQRRCLDFGAGLFCSKADLDLITNRETRGSAYIIPNTYPSGISNFAGGNSGGYNNKNLFFFVGTLNYEPNASGLKWFITTIFPHLRELNNHSKLIVVGRWPSEELKRLCEENPDIELYADAPDVIPFYEKCGIFIVPVLTGGGTRIKILEAAMARRLVFSTPFGAYGLDVDDGKELMLFTDKDSFIKKYNSLDSADKYGDMVNKLRILVENKYSPDGFSKSMEVVCNDVFQQVGV
jgi:glycosyltransferase involved in cell wall biosynthesis